MSLRDFFGGRARPASSRPLQLEALEDRNLPSAAPVPTFIASLYQGVLKHDANDYAIDYWGANWQSPTDAVPVARAVVGSDEARAVLVDNLYQQLLGRPLDSAGKAYFATGDAMKLDRAKAIILGSGEFYARVGGRLDTYLQSVYQNVLGRTLDMGGATYWGNALQQGQSRTAIARQIIASTEAAQKEIRELYQDVLVRDLDGMGLRYWMPYRQKFGFEGVLSGLLGSGEYWHNTSTAAANFNGADPNEAARILVSGTGGFFGAPVAFVAPKAGTQYEPSDASLWAPSVAATTGFIGSQPLLELAYGLEPGTLKHPVKGQAPELIHPSSPGGSGETGGTANNGLTLATHPTDKQRPLYRFDDRDRVMIYVRGTPNVNAKFLANSLTLIGMNVTNIDAADQIVSGFLALDKIPDLAQVPHFAAATPGLLPHTSAGSVTSAGDAVMQTNILRGSLGLDGAGVKVGVLSDSLSYRFGGLRDSVNSGDLPNNVQVLDDSVAGQDEGRAMLEIVHDVAPGASLAFATAFGSPTGFANNIRRLQQAGSRVIVDDVGYFNSPFFNDGRIAQAADDVVLAGSTYFSAAGNAANKGFLGGWKSIQATVGGITGTFADPFNTNSPLQPFTLGVNQSFKLSFQWNAAFLEEGSNLPNFQVPNDIDVLVTDSTGQSLKAMAATNNPNTNEAWEFLTFTNNGSYGTNNFALSFNLFSGPAPTEFRWILSQDSTDIRAQGEGASTIFGQPAARLAVAVGAVAASDPTVPESFTSLGGALPFYFDRAGNRLATPEFRIKPEIAAPDAVRTLEFPSRTNNIFSGTSAAAPHAAGLAALLFQQRPDKGPFDVYTQLERTAIDISPTGFDFLTGNGLIQGNPFTPVTLQSTQQPDGLENNDVTDQASNRGTIVPGAAPTITNVGVQNKPDGLPDYDVYRWTTSTAAFFTAKLTGSANVDLELHIYTLVNNRLVRIGSNVTKGAVTKQLTVLVGANMPVFVQVKGREQLTGIFTTGNYTLGILFG